MQTPVIITVFDKKMRNRGTTAVDYSRVDDVVGMIKETLEKKEWTHTVYIPPTENLFVFNLKNGQ